ncbi:MAG: hypothetical protein P1U88_07675 [Thalassobaculaceae bacterium]|nr:hypothetical protein [Thalassobaculaceae bacterium]
MPTADHVSALNTGGEVVQSLVRRTITGREAQPGAADPQTET